MNFAKASLEPAACNLYIRCELNTAGQHPTTHVPSASCRELHGDISCAC